MKLYPRAATSARQASAHGPKPAASEPADEQAKANLRKGDKGLTSRKPMLAAAPINATGGTALVYPADTPHAHGFSRCRICIVELITAH